MYNKFFDFKEKPFELDSDPEYLFMSKNHGETLAHLIFSISHGEEFVGIVGEAGTGKTILCKAFLNNLDESVKAAYVPDPELDSLQLFKSVYDAFGIHSIPDNTQDVIDILREFLIKKKAAGQKYLLLIDEAQKLSLELLEQLFLISDPKNTGEKLLQIILVGQPEMEDMLSARQSGKPGQRSAINCRLHPLSFLETVDYIRHRTSHAAHRACPPFDKASCRSIFEYSKGVPQLINIACDMALQHAFKSNSFKITGAITREAIAELTRPRPEEPAEQDEPESRPRKVSGLAILSAVLVCMIVVLLYFIKGRAPEKPAIRETAESAKVPAVSEPIKKPETDTQETPGKQPAVSLNAPGEGISVDMDALLVHVGTFETAYQAKWRLKNLKSLGFPCFMHTGVNTEGKTVYLVFAGEYKSQDRAEEASRLLSEKGHRNVVALAREFIHEGSAK